jgi:AcrR family transcriptional regulator
MPKETFFNLPDEKRNRFISVSLEEFAKNTYKSSSISRIVNKLNIAKGSVYQYFENKKDLYSYIIDIAAKARIEYILGSVHSFQGDIYKLLKNLIIVRTDFDIKHPLYKLVLLNMRSEKFKDDDLTRLQNKLNDIGDTAIKDIIIKKQISGEIRNDISPDVMGFYISYVFSSIDQYMLIKHGAPFAQEFYSSINKAPQFDKLEKATDEIIQLLKEGLSPK